MRLNELSDEQRAKIMTRAEQDIQDLFPLAQGIIDDIRKNGDEAVVKYSRKFDTENASVELLKATPADFVVARARLEPRLIQAIELAYENIRRFHEEQMPEEMWFTTVKPGI
ncbi:MAG: histidinol dehydrogenase, partial [Anaerolineae bacterium]|nr:histidinol dehydrogenase [Anaerolineae bacterium]